MSDFKVGFSKVNMNPPLGIGIKGYYIPRFAKGFLGDLYVRMMAVSCGGKTVLMASVEVCSIETEISKRYSRAIAEYNDTHKLRHRSGICDGIIKSCKSYWT